MQYFIVLVNIFRSLDQNVCLHTVYLVPNGDAQMLTRAGKHNFTVTNILILGDAKVHNFLEMIFRIVNKILDLIVTMFVLKYVLA